MKKYPFLKYKTLLMREEQENTLLSFILLHLFSMNETLGYNDLSTLNDLMLNFKMLCIYFFIVNHNLNLQNFIKNVSISLFPSPYYTSYLAKNTSYCSKLGGKLLFLRLLFPILIKISSCQNIIKTLNTFWNNYKILGDFWWSIISITLK